MGARARRDLTGWGGEAGAGAWRLYRRSLLSCPRRCEESHLRRTVLCVWGRAGHCRSAAGKAPPGWGQVAFEEAVLPGCPSQGRGRGQKTSLAVQWSEGTATTGGPCPWGPVAGACCPSCTRGTSWELSAPEIALPLVPAEVRTQEATRKDRGHELPATETHEAWLQRKPTGQSMSQLRDAGDGHQGGLSWPLPPKAPGDLHGRGGGGGGPL